MHCSRWRLLRSGLEFHVCTINKSTHTKKSLETYLMILVHYSIYNHIIHRYIIPGILDDLPLMFFWFWLLYSLSFVQIILQRLDDIQIWTLRGPFHNLNIPQIVPSSLNNFLTFSAVCLGLWSGWKMKPLPIRCLPEGIAWWIRICLYISHHSLFHQFWQNQPHHLKWNIPKP